MIILLLACAAGDATITFTWHEVVAPCGSDGSAVAEVGDAPAAVFVSYASTGSAPTTYYNHDVPSYADGLLTVHCPADVTFVYATTD